jgi:hypothetical protein
VYRVVRTSVFLACVLVVCDGVYAQKPEPGTARPATPLACPTFHRSWYALDRTAITLGLVQAGAEVFDGIGTRRFVTGPASCYWCVEQDPLTRVFIGAKPTWGKMIAFGAIEDVASTYLHQSMRRSRHKFIQRLAPAVPLALTTIHITKGYGVLTATTNLCAVVPNLGPDFHPVAFLDGYTCVKSVETPVAEIGTTRRKR